MLFPSSKFVLIPLFTLAIAPTATATPVQLATPENTTVVAQMTQLYCTTYAPAGGIGLTVYDEPNGNVIGRLRDGVTVAYNVGDRSGDWAEVTGEDGTTGWVETVFLGCEDTVDNSSETSEEYYDQSSEESYDSYSDESYDETSEDSYSEEYYQDSSEETEDSYSY